MSEAESRVAELMQQLDATSDSDAPATGIATGSKEQPQEHLYSAAADAACNCSNSASQAVPPFDKATAPDRSVDGKVGPDSNPTST